MVQVITALMGVTADRVIYARACLVRNDPKDADHATSEPRLKPVIDRLIGEHMVIHDAIQEVDRPLVERLTRFGFGGLAPLSTVVESSRPATRAATRSEHWLSVL